MARENGLDVNRVRTRMSLPYARSVGILNGHVENSAKRGVRVRGEVTRLGHTTLLCRTRRRFHLLLFDHVRFRLIRLGFGRCGLLCGACLGLGFERDKCLSRLLRLLQGV